jgi:hypothetical protein
MKLIICQLPKIFLEFKEFEGWLVIFTSDSKIINLTEVISIEITVFAHDPVVFPAFYHLSPPKT